MNDVNYERQKNIREIPHCHELDLRIRALLLKCQPTLVDLLTYFVSLKHCDVTDGLRNPGERLMKIITNTRMINDNILVINNFNYTFTDQSVDIKTLEPQAICGILLSTQMGLMQSLCCCNKCEHDCLNCAKSDGTVAMVHLDTVDCLKRRCKSCGRSREDCQEQTFIRHLVLIQQLYESDKKERDGEIYRSFSENQPLEGLVDYRRWEDLWKDIVKGIATFCDHLSKEKRIDIDTWKDRSMDLRIVLRKSACHINSLFCEDWYHLYGDFSESQSKQKQQQPPQQLQQSSNPSAVDIEEERKRFV